MGTEIESSQLFKVCASDLVALGVRNTGASRVCQNRFAALILKCVFQGLESLGNT